MKRIIFVLLCMALFMGAKAQNEVDALRYAFMNPIGTARYSAMGGAMGAMGGDLTSMAFNPAGIGIYRSSTMAFTPTWTNTRVNSSYMGVGNLSTKNNMHLSNIGFVSSIPDVSNEVKFVNFGFAYNQLANYNRNIYISGVNDYSSLLDEETDYVNNSNVDGSLFTDADVIYQEDGTYINDYMGNGYGEYQTNSKQSKGYAGQYDFSLAANFLDVIYAGISFGILHVSYEENSLYSETPPDDVPNLNYFDSYNYFNTKGNGYNFKFGVIARVTDWFRLGAAIHTPTYFSNMKDRYSSKVTARIDYVGDPNSENTAKSPDGYFDWTLSTPFKALGSAAFIFGKTGLISFDYEYIDYSHINMQSFDYDFRTENDAISNMYGVAHNFKVGGEYNYGPFSIRGGWAYYGSPYQKIQDNENANNMIYSGGLGFKMSKMFVDFTCKYSAKEEYFFMYDSRDAISKLENTQLSFIATMGFKF